MTCGYVQLMGLVVVQLMGLVVAARWWGDVAMPEWTHPPQEMVDMFGQSLDAGPPPPPSPGHECIAAFLLLCMLFQVCPPPPPHPPSAFTPAPPPPQQDTTLSPCAHSNKTLSAFLASQYLSGTFRICQCGANSCIFRVFSIFRPEHQNFIP